MECFTVSQEAKKKQQGHWNMEAFYWSGGVCTYKNGGLDKVLPGVGLENLVLETDSPYLSPVRLEARETRVLM